MNTIKHRAAWVVCWLALALVGCAPGADGVKQGISATSRVVAAGYRSLGVYDVGRQTQIRANAVADPKGAAAQLTTHLAQYDTAKQALDSAADTLAAAVKFETLYEQGAAKSSDAASWITSLAAAAISVGNALHTMGVY